MRAQKAYSCSVGILNRVILDRMNRLWDYFSPTGGSA